MLALTGAPASFACARQYAAALRVSRKWPRRWMWMTWSHSSSLMLKSIRSRVTPALLTTTSSRPKPSTAAASRASAVDRSPTSPVTMLASPPRERISSAVPSAPPGRSLSTTRAPASASARASARPSPAPAPVTIATLPSREVVKVSVLQGDGGARAGRQGALHGVHVLGRGLVGLELEIVVVVQLEHGRRHRLAQGVGLTQVEIDLDLHGRCLSFLHWSDRGTRGRWGR